jgi:hypothetical protein
MVEWIALLLLLLLFVCAVLVEIRWLVRNGWATSGRATAFVLVTDLLGFAFGTFIVLTVFFVMFMMVMGPAGQGSNVPESAYIANLIVAIILPPLVLILFKRLFLWVFKIQSGKPAWLYSIAASLAVLAVTLLPPPIVYYLLGYTSLWK